MLITEKIRKKLLLSLPKGYAKTVSDKCGCAPITVYRVLHHGQENEKVSSALIQLAIEHKQWRGKKEKVLKKLTSKL